MTAPRFLRRAGLLAPLLVLAACQPPKYVTYTSIHGDWRCAVPWGWQVMTDQEERHFTQTNFIGPFEPEFYLGVPSLSVRWHAYNRAHRLPDGLLEMYSSADDYIRQMLDAVYGSVKELRQPVHEITVAGRKAKHFVVLSGVGVPKRTRWGTSREIDTGRKVVVRQHAYVVVPLTRGFYVLVYPATRDGFKFYEPHFNQLVNTFTPLAEGPGGPPLPKASAAPAARL